MIKVIGLMKRRPGMTREEFRDYYESHHRVLGETYIKGHACKYLRRYLAPLEDPALGQKSEPSFDAIMEIWYPDQAALDAASAVLARPEIIRENGEDMQKLFDIPKCEFFVADECESNL